MVYDIGFTSLSNSGSLLAVEWWNSETWKLPTKPLPHVEISAAVVVVWQAPKGERLEVDAKLTLADGGPVFPPTPGFLDCWRGPLDFGRIE